MNRAAIASELDAIATRVARNEPHRRDPEAFHEEKSEIVNDLVAVARKLRSRNVLE